MKVAYKKTGALEEVKHGLVDYIATGLLLRNDEWIPCEIGYTLTKYDFVHPVNGNIIPTSDIDPTHIFVKDGITESGNHYEAETIEL